MPSFWELASYVYVIGVTLCSLHYSKALTPEEKKKEQQKERTKKIREIMKCVRDTDEIPKELFDEMRTNLVEYGNICEELSNIYKNKAEEETKNPHLNFNFICECRKLHTFYWKLAVNFEQTAKVLSK